MTHGDGVRGSFLKSRDIRLCDYLQKFYDIPVGLICVCAIFQFGFTDHAYWNPATDTIAKLDMHSDLYLKDMEETE